MLIAVIGSLSLENRYNEGETVKIMFGISGYTEGVDPKNIKMTVYSELDTRLEAQGEKKRIDTGGPFNIYFMMPDPSTSIFKTKVREDQPLSFESDRTSPFKVLVAIPNSAGDKRLIFILTYSLDGKDWHTISKDFEYHVNTWPEANQTFLVIMSVVLGLGFVPWIGKLAIDKILVPIGKWLWIKFLHLVGRSDKVNRAINRKK